MLLTIEKVILLRGVSFFSELPDESLAGVAAVLREEHLAPGKVLMQEGDLGTTLYIVVTGRVQVETGGRRLATLTEREVVGELAALDPARRSATVTAVEETHLLALDHESLFELLDEHGEVSRGIIRVLCRRFRDRG